MTELLVERSALLDAVQFAAKALPRSAFHPALTGLRLTSDGDALEVSAFDYENYAAAKVDADGVRFDVLLPGASLLRYLAGMTGERVSIVPGEREVALTAGDSRVILRRLALQDYPSAPPRPATVGTLDAEVLTTVLASVRPSIDPNVAKTQQRGVLILFGSPLTVAGVNPYRLCVREVEWAGSTEGHAIVPVHALDGAQAFSGPVTVGCDDGRISLADESRVLVARLIEHQPDNIRPMLNLGTVTATVTFDREELIAALRWVVLGDTRKQARGTLTFDIRTDSVGIALMGVEVDAETQVSAKVDGDPLVMGWMAENLLYGLAATDAEKVTLSMQGPTRAALLTADDDPGLRYLAMPWRLPT